jgi:7-cyano-7-deazaguanine synthase
MNSSSGRAAVVLVSGGLDSATAFAVAASEGYRVHALTVQYGQRHASEIDAARAVASRGGAVAHKVVELDLRVFGGSALTDSAVDVPKDRDPCEQADIPVTYVPARNTILLSLALAWAEVIPAQDIFIGVNALDYSGYPDCRPEFIAAFERAANLGTKAGTTGHPIRIHAPLISLGKSAIIQRGLALGVDYGITTSCYDPEPGGVACGRCDACVLRRRGFEQAGVRDPVRYAREKAGAR